MDSYGFFIKTLDHWCFSSCFKLYCRIQTIIIAVKFIKPCINKQLPVAENFLSQPIPQPLLNQLPIQTKFLCISSVLGNSSVMQGLSKCTICCLCSSPFKQNASCLVGSWSLGRLTPLSHPLSSHRTIQKQAPLYFLHQISKFSAKLGLNIPKVSLSTIIHQIYPTLDHLCLYHKYHLLSMLQENAYETQIII